MKNEVDMGKMQAEFVKAGVWIRPFGKLAYLMPPFIIQPDELTRLTTALIETIKKV